MIVKTTQRLARAAGYIRMSSGKQERSPAQQRGEIDKLGAAEACQVVLWFQDSAITGDSGTDDRPGLADLVAAAEHGEFQVLLLYHSDRLGRADSLESAAVLSRLRAAGVRIVTCSEGELDLTSFQGRLTHLVRQEGNHEFLRDLSRKVTRGQIANAKAGNSNGGSPKFAMDRALVDASGTIVRRLAPGETARMAGHRVRLVPTEDSGKLAALSYMFERFDRADISCTALAAELENRGYLGPKGNGWSHATVAGILGNPVYRGIARWGAMKTGRYHTAQGADVVPVDKARGRTRKPAEDTILVEVAGCTVVSPSLFDRVQRKLAKRTQGRHTRKAAYSLAGLVYCEHCGRAMHGCTVRRPDRQGHKVYAYPRYVCASYNARGKHNPAGCGHYTVDAQAVERWLVRTLQKTFLGPGREKLVAEIAKELKVTAKTAVSEGDRLRKRLAELDQEVARLVKAIRSCDVPELVQTLATTKEEREGVRATLAGAIAYDTPGDLDREAERLADTIWQLGQRLSDGDPGTVRGLFQRMVSRITCRFEKLPRKKGRQSARLITGTVELRPSPLFDCLSSDGAHAPTSQAVDSEPS